MKEIRNMLSGVQRANLLLLFVLFGVLSASGQTPSVSVTPTGQQISVDSSGYVRVRVNNIQNLHAYNVRISYDPLVVRCRLVRGLGFLGTGTFFSGLIDSINGSASVNEAMLGPGGQSGTGDLAEFRFVGLANGTATLVFSISDFRDTVNQTIVVTTQGGSIQVGQPNAVLEQTTSGIPEGMRLTNYPNPFNPTTTIRYYQDRPGLAVVRVFTVLGQEVYVEEQFNTGSGDHSLVWKGQDRDGHDLPSGTYIVQVQTTQGSASRKIMLLR